MNNVQRYLVFLFSVATGALFLYSAYTKLFPTIQSFEYTIVEFTHIPLLLAKILARFFVGVEASLGALLILHFYGRNNWVIRAAFLLVAAFSLFLLWLWVSAGNNVNCGCFGDAIWMRPSESLIKNAVLLAVLGYLARRGNGFRYGWTSFASAIVIAGTLVTLYIIFPVYDIYKVNLKPIYADKKWAPATNLISGKHIVAFLSPSCIHCRKAAKKMEGMIKSNPTIPFYMILGGVESDLTDFWKDTRAVDIPYTRLNRDEFLRYTKGVYPQIFWLNNSWVEENTGYPELDQKLIEKWMK